MNLNGIIVGLIILIVVFVGCCNLFKQKTIEDNAQKWLNIARERSATGDIHYAIEYMEEHLTKAGKSLTDIGTNEKEVEKLLIIGNTSEAKDWLELARERSATGDISYAIEYMAEYLTKADKSLADIGTNEKEVDKLLIIGNTSEAQKCLNKAKDWLNIARERSATGDIHYAIEYMEEHLTKAGKSLTDIGTNEKEVEKLLKRN